MSNGSDRLPAGDQSNFQAGWQTVCKVRDLGEPTSLPGEDRFGWQTRVDAYVATWSGLDADERRMVIEHGWASDYPETAERWLELGREAGFAAAEAMLEAPPRLGTVYKFQA